MSPRESDRRYGAFSVSPSVRAWGDAHPAGVAVVQALVFGILFGIITALISPHDSIGSDVGRAAIAAVVFGLIMWALNARRRRAERG